MNNLMLLIISVFLPPLAVFLRVGLTPHFLISIGLTLLGWVPGLIHAMWVINESPEHLALKSGSPRWT